ncbi:hypothetical protein ABBQ32_001119 [Trebouxia sp. C0010 RCD-2024]
MQNIEPDQVQLEHNASQEPAPHTQEPLQYAPVASSDHDRRFQKKVPPTTVAPTYKLTLPSEFVLTHMPDMMASEFVMISADGTQSFTVSIVPRRNKDKFEYTVQAKAWKQVVEGLLIKEGDLLEFELTAERALRVTVMKSSTVTRKPKKLGVPELQANMAKKKAYRGLPPNMLMPGQEAVAMSDLLLPAAAAAAAQGLPIRLPDVNATQEALAAAAAAHYQGGGEEDVYPAGAHAIGHSGVHGEGAEGAQAEGAPQMVKRTSDWVQEGEEEQDEAKKARIDGDPGASPQRKAGANGRKGGRNSAGAMNLLANAAEDNEAYENTLTHAQLQQLQQHLLQQQFQVRGGAHQLDPRLLLSKRTIEDETQSGLQSVTALGSLLQRLDNQRILQSVDPEVKQELEAIRSELQSHTDAVLDMIYRIKKVPKAWI